MRVIQGVLDILYLVLRPTLHLSPPFPVPWEEILWAVSLADSPLASIGSSCMA
ncbi:hypothetical protein I79_000609 [Cricetulus griseus]|uniref:Uncharacterized protein n=1 Tax=Cricetulus griseus TaxID=10029 RepID=G3GSJ4_CRIGR|nr:hypothetical protein I79_000609 [Cricetulus griseus]